MSQLPPPSPYEGQPPYGSAPAPHQSPYPYPAPRPRRKRPRAVWFFVGGTLLLLAPIIFAAALFTVLRPLALEDAVFVADGSPVQVDLAAGEERALFANSGAPANCSAVDGAGAAVQFRPANGEFNYNEWTAVSRFDTGDGNVTFTCSGLAAGSEVRIAQLPSMGGFVSGIVIGVVAPLVLGGIGLLVLIIATILYATGAPRNESASAAS